jgi:hypothetical protein
LPPHDGGRRIHAAASIRDCDMVTLGTMSTFEAEEGIELSLSILEGRRSNVELQFTRSKKALLA